MSIKFKDEIETSTSYDNLMDENTNVVFELVCLVSNIKNVGVLVSCFSFLRKYEKNNSSKYCLMLDNKFTSFCLMSSLIGYEQGKAMVKEYDTNLSIYPMF